MDASHIGVMFDCDGTLIDSMVAWRGLEDEMAGRVGIELSRADKDAITAFTIPECAAFFHERGLGASVDEVIGLMDDYMLAFYRERAVPRPGSLDFVRGLHEAGARLCITSSSPQRYLQAGMERCGFAPYLHAIVSVDDVGASKREPAVWNHACELLGTPRATTWGVEDSVYAVHTLTGAGYPTLGIYDCDLSGTKEQLAAACTHTIDTFEDFTAEDFLRIAG